MATSDTLTFSVGCVYHLTLSRCMPLTFWRGWIWHWVQKQLRFGLRNLGLCWVANRICYMFGCSCVFIQSRADISIELLKPHLVPTVKLKAEQLVVPRKLFFFGNIMNNCLVCMIHFSSFLCMCERHSCSINACSVVRCGCEVLVLKSQVIENWTEQ